MNILIFSLFSFFSSACAFGEMFIPFIVGKLFSLEWASYPSLFPVVAMCSFVGLISLAVALLITRNINVASQHSLVLSGSEGERNREKRRKSCKKIDRFKGEIAKESDFERELNDFGGLEDGLDSL